MGGMGVMGVEWVCVGVIGVVLGETLCGGCGVNGVEGVCMGVIGVDLGEALCGGCGGNRGCLRRSSVWGLLGVIGLRGSVWE